MKQNEHESMQAGNDGTLETAWEKKLDSSMSSFWFHIYCCMFTFSTFSLVLGVALFMSEGGRAGVVQPIFAWACTLPLIMMFGIKITQKRSDEMLGEKLKKTESLNNSRNESESANLKKEIIVKHIVLLDSMKWVVCAIASLQLIALHFSFKTDFPASMIGIAVVFFTITYTLLMRVNLRDAKETVGYVEQK